MNDLFMVSLALSRIKLMAQLVASSDYRYDDKEVAISWLSKLPELARFRPIKHLHENHYTKWASVAGIRAR